MEKSTQKREGAGRKGKIGASNKLPRRNDAPRPTKDPAKQVRWSLENEKKDETPVPCSSVRDHKKNCNRLYRFTQSRNKFPSTVSTILTSEHSYVM